MALFEVLTQVAAVVALAVAVSLGAVVGFSRFPRTRQQFFTQLRIVAPYLVFLGIVLGFTSALREVGTVVQWAIGFHLSPVIFEIEGTFVAWLQTFQTSTATTYFSAIYVYGYAYLLVFPIVAYALADRTKPLRLLILAYILNYVIGLVCYILFIAYGPRNYLIGEGILYSFWPQAQFLTSEVNTNTNVFPSLHTSLSVTVATLAVMTRDLYPRWAPIAIPIALSVCLSTMYLGIHWGVDVLAGAGLAAISVYGAVRLDDHFERGVSASREWWETLRNRLPI
ncbi:phosphatase PAP2 family protein [Halapricum salinum]|uniref:Inositol phosphorylceramide synthase n=1 Tax=Halapricum salinum TaxID=1457250 RepID=A0A4D6HGW8_9EURY|nr:phosphatase PAP2 family protein [Halapricum salinum]QCC52242.1 inositol phosphorylceramide synthase [Halapricum salinum]